MGSEAELRAVLRRSEAEEHAALGACVRADASHAPRPVLAELELVLRDRGIEVRAA
jgi:hypothetical protein